jgi:hypothetical protein
MAGNDECVLAAAKKLVEMDEKYFGPLDPLHVFARLDEDSKEFWAKLHPTGRKDSKPYTGLFGEFVWDTWVITRMESSIYTPSRQIRMYSFSESLQNKEMTRPGSLSIKNKVKVI